MSGLGTMMRFATRLLVLGSDRFYPSNFLSSKTSLAIIRLPAALLVIAGGLSACSSSNPDNSDWMRQSKNALNSRTLTQITIPGSHYANAYDIIAVNNQPPVCKGEMSHVPPSAEALLYQLVTQKKIESTDLLDYLNTQQSNVRLQLRSGIRYLELKICIQDAIYYTSNYYLTATLDDILEQIARFLSNNKSEIVFVDLGDIVYSDTGKITSNDIDLFHSHLQAKLGSYLTPKKNWQKLTFAKLWQTNHRLILLSANPLLGRYSDVWDKNQVMNTVPLAKYTVVKKLTMLEQYLHGESAVASFDRTKFTLIPLYSEFDLEFNSLNQLKTLPNDHLLIDYLYSLPKNDYLNIIVGERQYNQRLVEYSLYHNSNYSPHPVESVPERE